MRRFAAVDASEEAPELWRHWSVDLSFVPDGGESIAAMAARVRKACEELWEEAAFSDVIVVCAGSSVGMRDHTAGSERPQAGTAVPTTGLVGEYAHTL